MTNVLDQATTYLTAIRNPADDGHFMVVQPVKRPIRILLNNVTLVESDRALRVIEMGSYPYVPRIYVPRKDVKVPLERLRMSTYCPLKGNAFYFSYQGQEIAWAYEAFRFAAVIDGYLSFDHEDLQIFEGG